MTDQNPHRVTVEHIGQVARVTLDRPDKRNAMDTAMLDALTAALTQLDMDRDTSVILIRGNGPSFCSGYDISTTGDSERAQRRASGDVLADWQAMKAHAGRWLALWNMATPTIAQVQGYCLAGGAELALMCDLVIVADDALIGHPVVRDLGVPPVVIYPYLIGMRRAKEMMLTGNCITGIEAVEIGLVNRSVPAADLERAALDWATTVAEVPKPLLAFNKHATNMAFAAMGIEPVLRHGATLDALAHNAPEVKAAVEELTNARSVGRLRSSAVRGAQPDPQPTNASA